VKSTNWDSDFFDERIKASESGDVPGIAWGGWAMPSGDPSIQECHAFRMIIRKAVEDGALARSLTGYALSQEGLL
jgi:hypothetical protein